MIKNKKSFFLILFSFLFFSIHAQQLKIATIAPSRSVWDVEAKKLSQEWAKATNGKVKMQFMNATAMGGETGVITKLNSIRPGQKAPIDGAIFTNIGIAALAPETDIFTTCAPFLFRNQEEVDLIYDTFEDKIQKALSKRGYYLLGTFSVGWAYFYTKKPVHTPEDLKTQKLSVGGMGLSTLSDTFKAAGFRTEDVAPDKLLQSMKTPGGVEGFYTIPMYAYAGQYYKSLPYILNVPICPVVASFVINEKTWNSFTDAEKKSMIKAVKDAEKVFLEEQKNADKEYLKLCEEGGCTIITPTAAEYKVFEETLKGDAKAMTKTGLMDQEFYNQIQKVLKEYRGE
ncbi:MAG: TRAP transporter substrate-binding protein DctP [Treponema sp.]|nr:TRAP transporter substrate-binding protein DctP [Treponema sp.]